MGMIRHGFDQELEALRRELLLMGEIVQQAIKNAVTALATKNMVLARSVMNGDDTIDRMQVEIEDRCIALIARQQPVAKDLRILGTGLKITTDLERIGDHAFDIAKIVVQIGDDPLIKPLVDIPRMAELAQAMLQDCLQEENIEYGSRRRRADPGADEPADHCAGDGRGAEDGAERISRSEPGAGSDEMADHRPGCVACRHAGDHHGDYADSRTRCG